MSFPQLQSIKNAVNTHKVSFPICTPQRHLERPCGQRVAPDKGKIWEVATVPPILKCHPQGVCHSMPRCPSWSQSFASKRFLVRWKCVISGGKHRKSLRKHSYSWGHPPSLPIAYFSLVPRCRLGFCWLLQSVLPLGLSPNSTHRVQDCTYSPRPVPTIGM